MSICERCKYSVVEEISTPSIRYPEIYCEKKCRKVKGGFLHSYEVKDCGEFEKRPQRKAVE